MPLGSVTCPSCRFFTSWASQRLVVVSSFKTWAKVVSLSWSGRHCRSASLALYKNKRSGEWMLSRAVFFFHSIIICHIARIYKESNELTWSCPTGAGNSGLHASADELMALWRAAGPFCPEEQKGTISHKKLLGVIYTAKMSHSHTFAKMAAWSETETIGINSRES